MHAHSAVARPPTASLETAVYKAIAKVEGVAGLTRPAGRADDAGPSEVRIALRSLGTTTRPARRPGPRATLSSIVTRLPAWWRGVKWSGDRWAPFEDNSGDGWTKLGDRAANGPTIQFMASVRHPNDWEPIEAGLRLWAPAAGLTVAGPAQRSPGIPEIPHEIDLALARDVEWLPTVADVATLIAGVIQAEGGPPCVVTIESNRVDLGNQRWWDGVLAGVVSSEQNGMFTRAREVQRTVDAFVPIDVVVRLAAATDEAALDDVAAREVVMTLHRAQRTAPRGYVGLKHFRDKLLMPGSEPERRRALFDAVLEAGVVRTGRAVDPSTGVAVTTVEPNIEHPIVADALRASEALPELLELAGELLSATVVAAREADR